jgi:phenylalanyl-tRNA synthetase beta chain
MKISYNWLKEYLDFDLQPEALSELLTNCGLEVEGMQEYESVKGGLEGVVVGEVKTCERHPGADKLSITTVDVGKGDPLPVVCGAPNVAAGQKVLVATVGTTLYMGEKPVEIKKVKIRGEVSEGMICAEDELGLGDSHEGIMVLDPESKVGAPATEYFKIYRDVVYEIGLTPNRTDAMSHIGVARDIAAVLNIDSDEKRAVNWPKVESFSVEDESTPIELVVEDPQLCPRFSGVAITEVKVGESPSWLKNYLNAVGIRPINNIVDVTNFVLMELGQPLHAYDIKKIKGDKVVVRTAHEGEKFTTLDEVERELSTEDLMICNEKDGMCIAGVFGGAHSGVTGDTKGIYLESAHFNPVSIRKTSRRHGLQTDASFRFERGSDPDITVYALKRAALLIREIAGGKISSSLADSYPDPIGYFDVQLKYAHLDRLIGKKIERETVKAILQDLGIKIESERDGVLVLAVPPFKWDVTREADAIEEVIRIYGFNRVEMPSRLRTSLSFVQRPDRDRIRNISAEILTANGFYEIMSNSLTSSKYSHKSKVLDANLNVKMLNPLSSDLDVKRQSLFFGGMEAIRFNVNRKSPDLKLYEFGRHYQKKEHSKDQREITEMFSEEEFLSMLITGRFYPESWKYPDSKADVYDLKAFVINLLTRFGLNEDSMKFDEAGTDIVDEGLKIKMNGEIIATLGSVSAMWLKHFELKTGVFYAEISIDKVIGMVNTSETKYQEIPRYPEVRRDLALLISRNVTFDEISNVAYRYEKRLLKSINLFDIYEGEKIDQDKKSYAVSFILQDPEKTLTDKLIDKTMEKLIKAFEKELGATIRS